MPRTRRDLLIEGDVEIAELATPVRAGHLLRAGVAVSGAALALARLVGIAAADDGGSGGDDFGDGVFYAAAPAAMSIGLFSEVSAPSAPSAQATAPTARTVKPETPPTPPTPPTEATPVAVATPTVEEESPPTVEEPTPPTVDEETPPTVDEATPPTETATNLETRTLQLSEPAGDQLSDSQLAELAEVLGMDVEDLRLMTIEEIVELAQGMGLSPEEIEELFEDVFEDFGFDVDLNV